MCPLGRSPGRTGGPRRPGGDRGGARAAPAARHPGPAGGRHAGARRRGAAGLSAQPLADPAVLGASNAAALGAVAALYFGLAEAQPLALPALAILGALAAMLALQALAGRSESPLTLVLAGIAVGTLAGAGIQPGVEPVGPIRSPPWRSPAGCWARLADRDLHHVELATPLHPHRRRPVAVGWPGAGRPEPRRGQRPRAGRPARTGPAAPAAGRGDRGRRSGRRIRRHRVRWA